MPRATQQALAKRKTNLREAKPVMKYWFMLRPKAIADERGVSFEPRFTDDEDTSGREKFAVFIHKLIYAAEREDSRRNRIKAKKRAEAERVARQRAPEAQSQRDVGDDTTDSGSVEDNDELTEDTDDEEEDEDTRPMEADEYIELYNESTDFSFAGGARQCDTVPRTRWWVSCLESKGDFNMLIHLHKGVSKQALITCANVIMPHVFETELTDEFPAAHLTAQLAMDPVKSTFGCMRYLAFGVSDDGHKTMEDTDPTPKAGFGEIEWAKASKQEILTRMVQDVGLTEWPQCANWFWFTKSNLRHCIKMKQFQDEMKGYQMLLNQQAAVSTAASRLAKLRAYANTAMDDDFGVKLETLYEIFRIHSIDAREFQRKVLLHLTTWREPLKPQLCVIGNPGAGKSRLVEPILELLECVWLPDTSSLRKFEAIAKTVKTADVLVCKELQKAIKYRHLDEGEFCALWQDSATLESNYITFPEQLPVISMTQSQYYHDVDFKSIHERLDVIELYCTERLGDPEDLVTWKIPKEVMSYFLSNEISDEYTFEETEDSVRTRRIRVAHERRSRIKRKARERKEQEQALDEEAMNSDDMLESVSMFDSEEPVRPKRGRKY